MVSSWSKNIILCLPPSVFITCFLVDKNKFDNPMLSFRYNSISNKPFLNISSELQAEERFNSLNRSIKVSSALEFCHPLITKKIYNTRWTFYIICTKIVVWIMLAQFSSKVFFSLLISTSSYIEIEEPIFSLHWMN